MTTHGKVYMNLLFWLLKIAAPVNVVLFPSLAIYAALNHWRPTEDVMRNYAGQTPILVGIGSERRVSASDSGSASHESNQRSYILYPSVFHDPKIVVVENSDGHPSQVTETKAGFFMLLGWYLLCVVGTWWLWFRRKPVKT